MSAAAAAAKNAAGSAPRTPMASISETTTPARVASHCEDQKKPS